MYVKHTDGAHQATRHARLTAQQRRDREAKREAHAEAFGWANVLGERVIQCSRCASIVPVSRMVDLVGTWVCRECARDVDA